MVAHQIHTLLIVALLIPFAGICLAMFTLLYLICWKGTKS